jgi:hypothetical protein
MANLGVDTIKSEDGTKGPILDANLDFSESAYTVLPKGTTAERPTGVGAGFIRFNTDTKLVEQYNGIDWVTLNSYGVGRGVFGGSSAPTAVNTIDYITIATAGNVSYFGDLTQAKGGISACSSSTRGIFGGGFTPTSINTIDYITISTTGNASDFGDLTTNTRNQVMSCSSSTRGIFAGGSGTNVIDYITIATTGNATDFGDLIVGISGGGACASPIRGIFAGGDGPASPFSNIISYITIATTGNATDFGDLLVGRGDMTGCSNNIRGVFSGGVTQYSPIFLFINNIDYITIATTGNAQDFGDATIAKGTYGGCASSTRGIFAGGYSAVGPAPLNVYTYSNVIEYITLASNGTNAQDFGDLSSVKSYFGGLSDAHGGLA